ncbi:hypothetical protein A3A05_00515 [Candidatus Nomurabacteria bacterium RIFCSPLOWO2_01_FULL_41_12]|uniref:Lycopene cyclase domain-containing protein n=1 Tax=Candidatus Nomurabacteria bacterium RIFCSPLOWO2_01_FULL_41_12 TaxID=1801774 RepID=A0A1F6WWV5_9BACT|nr:MAG: hypothetical protein A2732_01755 [Candidatus Nomurabacteria bacterium RIFCSPHIGHO2_01_FULL_40_10]OGI86235.1 MAG: hypothetical protein A3A05_00515 [Candidatus Nomurabacteria bacterium RIFCSPLOWO2_01_FULL_41_12]
MWKFITHHEFSLGIFILFFSALWMTIFLGSYNWFVVLPLGISWAGLICLFDFFERKYFSHSVIPDTIWRGRKLFIISVVSLLFCVLLDGFGVFVARLWYYPFWSLKIYLAIAPFAFGAYTLLLFILYEFAKDLVTNHRKINLGHYVKKQFYEMIMNSELVLGIIGYLLSINYALRFLANPSLSSFIINQKGEVPFSGFYIIILVFIATFFIFEYICFKQNKQTLTHDILSGNFWPIIFITIANIIAIVSIEFLNGPFQVWVFANWPYDNIRILNVPVVAMFLWPLQFPVFLSMLRALFPSKEVVW